MMALAPSLKELAQVRSSARKLRRVFVSSTSEDLRDHRAVARNIILEMGWYPEMMEHFGAMPEPTVAACYEKLKQCDLLLLIVAYRRGWVPTVEQGGNGQDSVTALELAHAHKLGIPIVVPENSIRRDSPGEAESAHHPMRCLRSSTCLQRL
jgi:Domain of unknown function (DUF4062)